jgi:hypothetical protein
MHSGEEITLVDNFLLGRGELAEAGADDILWGEVLSQPYIGRVVACLRLEQTAVKLGQLWVVDVASEELEPLAAAGFDQPSD